MGKALHQDTLQLLEKDIRPDITPPIMITVKRKQFSQVLLGWMKTNFICYSLTFSNKN